MLYIYLIKKSVVMLLVKITNQEKFNQVSSVDLSYASKSIYNGSFDGNVEIQLKDNSTHVSDGQHGVNDWNDEFGFVVVEKEEVKYVHLLLPGNGNNRILAEFEDLEIAFDKFDDLDEDELEDGESYELAKYDEYNCALDWTSEELELIGQPNNEWITKS